MTDRISFHAGVSEDAMSKVSRLFNATLDDIFAELFQNARRAGATRVIVDRIDDVAPGHSPRSVIRVSDDGHGIADPRCLFTLGDSGWSSGTRISEDAAGMGFFSLAGRHVRVTAQETGTEASWVLDASPDAFRGRAPIRGRRGPKGRKGMEVLIGSPEGEVWQPAANNAARFFPLPVIVDGCEADRKDFLEGADHVEEWNGIRMGVFEKASARDYANLNFHGVTLRAPLPCLGQVFGPTLHVRLDVVRCAGLEMVLPARRDVVRNAFLETLKQEILRLFYRLVAGRGCHSLSFGDYSRGRALGIALPEAPPVLRPFSPGHADSDSTGVRAPQDVGPDALVYAGDNEPVEDQNLALLLDDQDFPALSEPCPGFEGYAWYDRLARLQLTGYRLDHGGRRQVIPIGVLPSGTDRPDRMFLRGRLTSPADTVPWEAETARLVLAPPDAHIDDVVPCVTATSSATHEDLVDHIVRALFSPSFDCDAGRYDDQLQWFTDEAEDLVVSCLGASGDVHRHRILRTVRRELWWILKDRSDVTIHIRGGTVDVSGLGSVFGMMDA